MDDKRPRGAIGTYIFNEQGQLFLMLRSSKHGNGTWCPPGGHIEYGESIEDAAKREAKEECGVDVLETEIMGVTSDVFSEEEKHYITVHVKAVKVSGEPKIMEPDKFKEGKWFSLNELPENLFPTNKNFFNNNPERLKL